MTTKENTYKKAFEIQREALKAKEQQRETLLSAAYSKEPKLTELDFKLGEIGALIAVTALSGDDGRLNELKASAQLLSSQKNALLKKHRVPEIQYDCDICKDSGYTAGKICQCIKERAGKILAAELAKQMPLDECRFESFNLNFYKNKDDKKGENPHRRMTSILKVCREYAIAFNPNTSGNLLFFGSAGLGKTHLTLSIVSEIIAKGYLPVYGSAENLFSSIESEKFGGESKGSYESMLNCDLLVIDDLGAEMTTSFTKSVLYNLVNSRILTKKPTIINTNLTMKEIEARYTPRIASRLIGNYEAYRFLGDDIRQQKVLNKL